MLLLVALGLVIFMKKTPTKIDFMLANLILSFDFAAIVA
jgi:hypothetical protein